MAPSALPATAAIGSETPVTFKAVPRFTSVSDHAEPGLLHRSLVERPYHVSHGSGSYLYLSNGRKILDGCGGAAVAILGHGNEEVVRATAAQMRRVSYVHTGAYTTDSAEDLADLVLASAPGEPEHGLEKAYFAASGSEANDAAMKLARQYFWEKGETQRVHYVSRERGYHGNSIGTMSISTQPARKLGYDGAITLPNTSFVSPAYPYRGQHEAETEASYVSRLIAELDDEFQRVGPQKVIAFFAETMVGASSGCVAPPKGYFTAVRALCDKYDILLVLDEVMCGMGRTGTWFAFQQEQIQPDIVTIGKGLGGGFAPIAGILVHKKVVDVLRRGTAGFNHGQTYQAHPVTCATALAVLQVVRRNNLVERSATMGLKLNALLHEVFQGCKYVGDIRGRGLFQAVEFVLERRTKKRFSPRTKFGMRVQQAAFSRDVAVYPNPMTTKGADGDHVLMAPPYTVSDEELMIIVSVLKDAYDEVEAAVDQEL